MSVASSSGCSSLVGYENNNEINRGKMKKQSANSDGSSNGTSATASSNGVSTTKTHRRRSQSQRGGRCGRSHLNCLWSVWYGLCGTLLQAYISIKCARRFLQCATLAWPETEPPLTELHAGLLLTTLAVLLLPLFLVSAVFKVGNNANDGVKLGRGISTCSRDPASPLLGAGGPGGGGGLWRHGGPTAPFLHIVTALCLLLPKLLMEARLIEAGFLPQEAIWKTDLDFMVVHRDRLVVLSFMTGPVSNFSTIGSSLPLMTSPSPLDTTTYIPPLASTNNMTTTGPKSQPFSMVHTLKDILGSDNIDSDAVPDAGWGTSVSVEYLNYALALFVYSIRYPAVFWNTNKCFGSLFSLQLLVNSAQCLLSYAGMSVLYKVQIVGPGKALPLLRHRGVGLDSVASFSAILGSNRQSPFLLNSNVTIGLFVLSGFLVLSSSLVLYLYGYGRFRAFVNAERARKVIALRDSNISGWGYFTHCAALCSLLSVAVVSAPLLHDYTVVYRGSLDGAILACIVAAILHLFLWIVLWLFLTIKQKWIFKLRVTVGRATVRSARSVKLVTDVDLITSHAGKDDLSSQPLLVVGNGRTYTIQDTSPKKTIMSVIQKTILDQKASSGQDDNEAEEQIYWLRPAVTSPKHSSDKGPEKCGWFNKRLGSTGSKHKVTFNDIPIIRQDSSKTELDQEVESMKMMETTPHYENCHSYQH